MAKAKVVTKKVMMSLDDIIRYQLLTHCFVHHIILSHAEINCLMILGRSGGYELAEFCLLPEVSDEVLKAQKGTSYNKTQDKVGTFVSAQTVRNFLTKAQKYGLVNKEGSSRKQIKVDPKLQMICEGTIVLDYKIAHVATQEQ